MNLCKQLKIEVHPDNLNRACFAKSLCFRENIFADIISITSKYHTRKKSRKSLPIEPMIIFFDFFLLTHKKKN